MSKTEEKETEIFIHPNRFTSYCRKSHLYLVVLSVSDNDNTEVIGHFIEGKKSHKRVKLPKIPLTKPSSETKMNLMTTHCIYSNWRLDWSGWFSTVFLLIEDYNDLEDSVLYPF